MKLVGILSTAVLSLTLGAAAPAFAQQDQHEQEGQKDKAAQEKEKKVQEEKTIKPEEKSAQEEKNRKPEENKAQEDKNRKPEEKDTRQHPEQGKPVQHGGRIPDDHYRAHFGREHTFRVSEGDYRNHRFESGGYSFGFIDPWPTNWLYTQDVFVVEINGVYYLCNASYPGVNLALSVNL
jgi:hypothetical protein